MGKLKNSFHLAYADHTPFHVPFIYCRDNANWRKHMAISSIAVLGGDLRQRYAAEYLCACGWQVSCSNTLDVPCDSKVTLDGSLPHALAHADVALLPTPLSKDGQYLFQANQAMPPCLLTELWGFLAPGQTLAVYSLPKSQADILKEKGCQVFQFGQLPIFSRENSLLTAEGLLSELIRCTPFSLASARVLLLGYGCCGSAIGTLLHPLCRSIYLLEQDLDKQAVAEKKGICPIQTEDFPTVLPHCNIIINTIPAAVMEPNQIRKLPGSCHIFDIASSPFGFPEDTAEKYALPYLRLPGLPGRFSPAASGKAIGKIIERITDYVL